jgi:hypothetical protein
VLVHAVEPVREPARTRLEKGDPETRMALQHAAHDEPDARGHLLERM